MREKKDKRIFFALWPDDTTRAALQREAEKLCMQRPARRVPIYNLHLTLHFIGNVSFAESDAMQAAARDIEAAAFDLCVDRVGHFAKPRVGWLGCGTVPPALADLHTRLGERLRECGFRPESRPYHPHVTILRKQVSAPENIEMDPVSWRVREFALIESRAAENGVQYAVAESYPLA